MTEQPLSMPAPPFDPAATPPTGTFPVAPQPDAQGEYSLGHMPGAVLLLVIGYLLGFTALALIAGFNAWYVAQQPGEGGFNLGITAFFALGAWWIFQRLRGLFRREPATWGGMVIDLQIVLVLALFIFVSNLGGWLRGLQLGHPPGMISWLQPTLPADLEHLPYLALMGFLIFHPTTRRWCAIEAEDFPWLRRWWWIVPLVVLSGIGLISYLGLRFPR